MSVSYDADARVFRVTVKGPVSFDIIRDQFAEMVRHPAFRPEADALWDMRSANLAAVGRDEVRRVRDWIAEHGSRRGARVAIVTARDVDFGVARMYELNASELPQEIQVFRDMAAAEAWIRRQDT